MQAPTPNRFRPSSSSETTERKALCSDSYVVGGILAGVRQPTLHNDVAGHADESDPDLTQSKVGGRDRTIITGQCQRDQRSADLGSDRLLLAQQAEVDQPARNPGDRSPGQSDLVGDCGPRQRPFRQQCADDDLRVQAADVGRAPVRVEPGNDEVFVSATLLLPCPSIVAVRETPVTHRSGDNYAMQLC